MCYKKYYIVELLNFTDTYIYNEILHMHWFLKFSLFQIRLDLAIKREEASKMGIIIQDIAEEENRDTVETQISDNTSNVPMESQGSVVDIVNAEEAIQSPVKRIKK